MFGIAEETAAEKAAAGESKAPRSEDWECQAHDTIFAGLEPLKESQLEEIQIKVTESKVCQLWMTPIDRLGVIALLINDDPKLPAFVPSHGQHKLPALVCEMLSVAPPSCWESGDVNLFALNKHHFNNGGVLASLLHHADYKVGPMTTALQPQGALAAIYMVLCRTLKIHGVKAIYFDGLLTAAMEHLIGIFNLQGRSEFASPLMFPHLEGSAALKEAHTVSLQHNYVPVKELARSCTLLTQVFAAEVVADDLTYEAVDRGLWLQRLQDRSAPGYPDAVLRHDVGQFSWQNTRFRSLTFAQTEILLMRHGHLHGLARVRDMRIDNKRTEALFPLVFIELKDIHASSVYPSVGRVMNRGRFFVATYFSNTDDCYNTLLVLPSNLWSAYQAFSSMHFLGNTTKIEGRDISRMPFAPLLFQLLTASGHGADIDSVFVAYSLLSKWLGLGEIDPVTIQDLEVPGPESNLIDGNKRAIMAQEALRFLLAQTTDELKGSTDAQRWDNLMLAAKAIVVGVIRPFGLMQQWTELCRAVRTGYHEHKAYLTLAKDILLIATAAKPSVSHEEKDDEPDTTYEDWYESQRKFMRPRVDVPCRGGCNFNKGCGESMLRFLVQLEMESLHYGQARVQFAQQQKKLKTASNCYHGCLSMFDPPLAWVLPDTQLVYSNSQVFFFRRQYDKHCDLSDTFHLFEWSFLHRLEARILAPFNDCRGKPQGKKVAVSATVKRGREEKETKKPKKLASPKRARVEPDSPQYDPSDSPIVKNPTYDPNSPLMDYSATSPSYAAPVTLERAGSPTSPAFSPLRSTTELEHEQKQREKSFAQRQREYRAAEVERARQEQARIQTEKHKMLPHSAIQARDQAMLKSKTAAMMRL